MDQPPVWLAVFIPAVVVGFIVGINFILSSSGGWLRLARQYRAQSPPTGRRYLAECAKMGWVNYNNCLTIHVSTEGVHIRIWPILRLFHPPLFIPLEALGTPDPVPPSFFTLWMHFVKLRVGDPPVTLWLRKKIFEALQTD